ncbi:hypothetical protein D3C77_400650 [compost metagenome]
MHLQHQWRRRRQAELSRHRCAIGPTNPDANQIARPDTNRPGIAKAVAGAGLPGQLRTLYQFGMGVTIRPCLTTENTADDPGTARRQQPTLEQRRLRLQTHGRTQTTARQCPVACDQIFQATASTAQNQRQIRFGQRWQCQRHTTVAHLRGKALGTIGFEQLHRGQVQRQRQGRAGRHRSAEPHGEIPGPIVAVAPWYILQQ